MALLPFDRTCHKLSYRVIGRSECKRYQTKNICIISLPNDADNYMMIEVLSPDLLFILLGYYS